MAWIMWVILILVGLVALFFLFVAAVVLFDKFLCAVDSDWQLLSTDREAWERKHGWVNGKPPPPPTPVRAASQAPLTGRTKKCRCRNGYISVAVAFNDNLGIVTQREQRLCYGCMGTGEIPY